MSDKVFLDGIRAKRVSENAPEWIKMKLSINRTQLISWLQNQTGDWIDIDIKESRSGNLYCEVDNWKPENKKDEKDKANEKKSNQAEFNEPFF